LSAKTLHGESPLGKQRNFSSSFSFQMQDAQSLGVRMFINHAISASVSFVNVWFMEVFITPPLFFYLQVKIFLSLKKVKLFLSFLPGLQEGKTLLPGGRQKTLRALKKYSLLSF